MAKVKSIFLLSLLLFLFISSSYQNEFNMYQFVLQWNPATCSDTDLTRPCVTDNRFTISGLWPTLSVPFEILGPCGGSDLDLENIRSLQTMLNRNWPNVVSGGSTGNSGVWREEWRKHGSCSEEYLDQFDYFSFALDSNARYNIHNILTTNGIVANESTYRRDNVQTAINRAIGARPALRCNRNYLSKTQQLHEIVLCYTKDDESLTNCPSNSRFNTCPSRFDWFPFMRTYQGYFQTVFQWQPATCNNTASAFDACLRPAQNRFTIAGVWPTSRANRILGPCEGTNFDANQIFTIRSRLDRDWPDLRSQRNNQNLWRNEWSNHGTCSENEFGQLQYFSFGLSIFDAHNITNILIRNNITPNGRTMYERQVVENIIRVATRSRPYLHCNTRRQGQSNLRQLHEVVLCYNEYGRSPIDCPPISLTRCPERFYWLPL